MTTPAAAASVDSTTRRFTFRMPRITRLILLGWGVGIRPAAVTVDDRAVVVRFGFYGITVPWAEIDHFEHKGPFTWWRALAVRHTLFHHDVSYCSDGRGAVVLYLKAQRPAFWTRHVDQVYIGIEDLDGLEAELRRRGVPGPATS
jgi:hypothetical protein